MLDEYVEEIRKKLSELPYVNEDVIAAYVYLSLGEKLSFDIDFLPFGSSKKRQAKYNGCSVLSELEDCMKNEKIICKSLAYIVKYILSKLNIDVSVVTDPYDFRKTPHVYNVIRPKDGSEPYIIDLQEDMYRIKMHDPIENFGLSPVKRGEYIIPFQKQKDLFKMLGYYTYEDYYDNMKLDLEYIDNFKDKVRFVLENIEICENSSMSHIDRQWNHARRLEKIFDRKTFNYFDTKGKIQFRNCYKIIDGERKCFNVIIVEDGPIPDIYIYSDNECRYVQVDFTSFANEVINGLTIHNAKILNLRKKINEIKRTS